MHHSSSISYLLIGYLYCVGFCNHFWPLSSLAVHKFIYTQCPPTTIESSSVQHLQINQCFGLAGSCFWRQPLVLQSLLARLAAINFCFEAQPLLPFVSKYFLNISFYRILGSGPTIEIFISRLECWNNIRERETFSFACHPLLLYALVNYLLDLYNKPFLSCKMIYIII